MLVLQMAGENEWGYERIQGELKKLGYTISVTTIKRILKERGFPTAPKRSGNWADFIRRHAETLWASDFVSKRILTKIRFVDCYLLFAIHIASRRVHLVGVTTQPTAAWMAQQARNLRLHFDELPVKPAYFIHDRDIKFTKQFGTILSNDKELEIIKLPARSPNLNAFAERWVRSFREECLDHFIVFGEGHMRHIAEEYIAHYNEERPHQGKCNNTLGLNVHESSANGPVTCKTRLGGLLKHYVRQAA
jgi:putative transposase